MPRIKTPDQVVAQSQRLKATASAALKNTPGKVSADFRHANRNNQWLGVTNYQRALTEAQDRATLKSNQLYKRRIATIDLVTRRALSASRSTNKLAVVTKTAIKVAAAGGDPYAKAWATRIAKYGPAGVSTGKLKK